VIDLHCHVLPGIDDGPKDIEGSLALARAAHAAGIRRIVATPHVSPRYPNEPAAIARLVEELNAHLAAEGIEVEVLPGAEIALVRAVELDASQLSRLTLGGGPWLLVEPPFSPAASGIDAMMLEVARSGHPIVIAHPERCPAFHRDRSVLESLVRSGMITSITAGSLLGHFGGAVRAFALELLREGLVHDIASDAHDHIDRPPGTMGELDGAGLHSLTAALTEAIPAAVLAGGEIPPAPRLDPAGEPRRTRSWPWRRGSSMDNPRG
jgi:protein-tyrosine phosphatase